MFKKSTLLRGLPSILSSIIVALTFILLNYFNPCFCQGVAKQTVYHHSVTENGNIQVRIITNCLKNGKVIDKNYSNPMTPADTKDMTGWDDKSKNIVMAIIDPSIISNFTAEHQKPIGVGVEEIVTYDRVIKEDGVIAVRRITRIYDNGKEVSKKFHRSWIIPGQDPAGNDVMSKAIAQKLHTPGVIAAYKAKIEAQTAQ